MNSATLRRLCLLTTLLITVAMGCSGKASQERWYEQGQSPETQWESVGLEFVQRLMHKDFEAAHEMLGSKLKSSLTPEELQTARRRLVSEQFREMDEPWVLSSIESWPDKRPGDQGMAYVQIGGDGNEAIAVTVALEEERLGVREIAWGRP